MKNTNIANQRTGVAVSAVTPSNRSASLANGDSTRKRAKNPSTSDNFTIIKGATLQTRNEWVEENRQLFLDNLAIFVPELLIELHDTVLPVLNKISAATLRHRGRGPKALGISISAKSRSGKVTTLPDIFLWKNLGLFEEVREVGALTTALREWATKYDLYVPWFLDAALLTLYGWARPSKTTEPHPIFGDDLYFEPLEGISIGRCREPLPYQHPAWQVGQSWSYYEERQISDFKAHLQVHRQVTLDGDFTSDALENPDHVTWTALAYGKRLNFRQIADLPERNRHWHGPIFGVRVRKKRVPEEGTVGKAVRSMAELIDLPKLRVRSGRPAKADKSGTTETPR